MARRLKACLMAMPFAVCLVLPSVPAQAAQAGRMATESWVFKPKDIRYTGVHKPVWRIKDLMAAHRGQADWSQTVIDDPWFVVKYISMAPGKSTPVSYEADTVTWFIVQSGQVRFNVKGQEPILAGPDFMVSIPARLAYSIETVGSAPSVRVETHVQGASPNFPVADNPKPPPAPPGYEAVKVTVTGGAATARPRVLDYDKQVVNNPDPNAPRPSFDGDSFFLRDARAFAVPIRAAGAPMNESIGHFHLGLAEWWYVLEGDMNTRIEGVGVVEAHHGDIVYSPRGAYHRTMMVGKPFSTRVATGATGMADAGASFSSETGGGN